ERAVAAPAGVVAAAEVRQLPAVGRRDEELARVRVRERGPGSPQDVGVVEEGRVAARLPAVARGTEAQLLALAPRDRLLSFPSQGRLDGRLAVEPARELARVQP